MNRRRYEEGREGGREEGKKREGGKEEERGRTTQTSHWRNRGSYFTTLNTQKDENVGGLIQTSNRL